MPRRNHPSRGRSVRRRAVRDDESSVGVPVVVWVSPWAFGPLLDADEVLDLLDELNGAYGCGCVPVCFCEGSTT
jgi:hypothetical protein